MVIKTKKNIRVKRKYNNKNKKQSRKNYKKKSKLQKGGATGGTVCAPNVMEEGAKVDSKKKITVVKPVHSQSCLPQSALNKLVNAWNKEVTNPKFKIDTSKSISPEKLYETMVRIFSHTNSRLLPEHEWWNQPWVIKNLSSSEISEIKSKYYSPDAPKSWLSNPTEWLSTLDIDAKLKQYEDIYEEFKYYGATPIDFDLKTSTGACQVNSICNVNLKQLQEQKTPKQYIGVVFNLDKHDEPGSHWIALFVNIPKQEINYWDSYAVSPPNEVKNLMKKLKDQGDKLKTRNNFTINVNNVRHQYKGSECGVYSCYFIIEQLNGRSFKDITTKVVKDDQMNAFRRKLFNF
jgi:hypothetical protein